MNKWLDAHDAYWWVENHPKLLFDGFATPWIEITPHKVCPQTRSVQDNIELNTKIEFWVEAGSHSWHSYGDEPPTLMPSNDYDLECGGDTWEEAVLKLAELVLHKYGDYDEVC